MKPSLYMKRCLITGFLPLIFAAFLTFNEALPYFGASPFCSVAKWPTITENISNHLPVILNKVYSGIMAAWHVNCESPQCAAQRCLIHCPICYAIEGYPGPMTMYAEFIPARWFNPSFLKYSFEESLTLRGRFYTYIMFTGALRPPATVKLVVRLAGLTIKRPLIAFIEAGRPYPANCWGELVSKVKETFYLRETARVRVMMKDMYGNSIDGKTAPGRNYGELFSAKILRSPEDKEPMYYERFKMSCPGACDGWLVIEWTPQAYQGGQYIWIGVKPVKPLPKHRGYTQETVGDPIPIRGTPIFFSVVPGGTPFSGASPRCSIVEWPATGREGMIPYVNMMVGLRYRVQVTAMFFACQSSECSGKICSATCPPCQIYKGYPGTFAFRGEYKTDKPAQKFGSAWIPSNFSESPQSRGLYLIDFSLSRDVKPPATLKIFTLIGGGENINYMIAKVQAGPPDPARTWGQWASEGKERVDLKSTAKFRVMMTDSYGNVINAKTAPDREYSQIFSVKILRNPSDSRPMYAENFKMSCNGQCNGPVCANSCDGWLTIEWTPMTHVGRQWLWIGVQIPPPSAMRYPNLFGLTLRAPLPIQGSPFMYTVLPATDVSRCVGDWRKDHLKAPNSFEVGKEIIFDISKKNSDNKFQSTWIYPFTIRILDANTKQPLNVGMKASQASELEVVQSVQFTLQRAGNFLLQVSGRQVPGRWTEFIIGSPFPFRMLPGSENGACDGAIMVEF